MEKKDTENKREFREENGLENQEANELRAEGRNRHRNHTRKINKLWLWLGILILVFILIWWLWTFGTAEDISGVTNG